MTNTNGTSNAVTVLALNYCTSTATYTATRTFTSTATATVTNSATNSATATTTNTATVTPTQTNTGTASMTPTKTATSTVTNSRTVTATSTVTNSQTVTGTATFTSTLTNTETVTPTFTWTALPNACDNLAYWSAAQVAYSVGVSVVDGTEIYKCIQAHTSNSGWAPPTTPSLWQDMGACVGPTATPNCSGATAWSSNSVSYVLDQKVTYGTELYQCIQAHTSNSTWTPPSSPTLWQDLGVCSGGGAQGEVARALSSGEVRGTITPTSTATLTATVTSTPTSSALAKAFQAEPNLSRNHQPITFHVQLSQPAQITLTLYTVLGEDVYKTTVMGSEGDNSILWALRNKAENEVGSGLYICVVQVTSGLETATHVCKVIVIH